MDYSTNLRSITLAFYCFFYQSSSLLISTDSFIPSSTQIYPRRLICGPLLSKLLTGLNPLAPTLLLHVGRDTPPPTSSGNKGTYSDYLISSTNNATSRLEPHSPCFNSDPQSFYNPFLFLSVCRPTVTDLCPWSLLPVNISVCDIIPFRISSRFLYIILHFRFLVPSPLSFVPRFQFSSRRSFLCIRFLRFLCTDPISYPGYPLCYGHNSANSIVQLKCNFSLWLTPQLSLSQSTTTFSSLANPSQRRRPLPSTQSTTQQTQNLSPSQMAQTTPPLFLQHQRWGLEPIRPAEPPRRVMRNPQILLRLQITMIVITSRSFSN